MYFIPEPKQISMLSGTFSITYQTRIVISTASHLSEQIFSYAELLKAEILQQTGLSLSITRAVPVSGDIVLCASDKDIEAYSLSVEEHQILAKSEGICGLLYAVQTLRQIIRQHLSLLPCCTILDSPAVSARGFYHDVTRGRIQTLDNLKKLADRMSFYKLNQLQLYVEHTYLFSEYSEVWRDNTPLTAEEILELDAYCKKLQIDLVPSIANFGHLYHMMRTKSLQHLCELENPANSHFSFFDRMAHHTINVADSQSIVFSFKLIEEYMSLFSSSYFNICGDETFDLGKGKSKSLADSIGLDEMYIQYIDKLCRFVVEHGKTPMFWGDIIAKSPEMITRLPKETICLNWGYASDQTDEAIRFLHNAGATQYVCPGTSSWNHIAGSIRYGYENITRMCQYGTTYNAIGVLNTDWGDFGHINHPEFSIPGLIYGAEFSWNPTPIAFEELNRRISRIEYLDKKELLVSFMDAISQKETFSWYQMVLFKELGDTAYLRNPSIFSEDSTNTACIETIQKANQELEELLKEIQAETTYIDSSKRSIFSLIEVSVDGISLCNELLIACIQKQSHPEFTDCALAGKLETWLYHYKALWRQNSKEAELSRIEEVIFWYADLLR